MRAREQTSGLGGMDALTSERLDEETVDHVDLLLQGFQGLERFAELHGGTLAFRTPVILIDAVAEEDDSEALREGFSRRGISKSAERFKPGKRHGAPRTPQHGAA